MVDFNKISKAVQDAVKDIAKTEGNKKKIDSQAEFAKLGNYLAGNGAGMNAHEQEYIEGLMIEYQNNEFEKHVTDATKDVVKDVAKRTYDKKKIDSDEEAQALVTLLRNTKGDLNAADIAYIRQILIQNGYERYIPKIILTLDSEPTPSTKPCLPEIKEDCVDIAPKEPARPEEHIMPPPDLKTPKKSRTIPSEVKPEETRPKEESHKTPEPKGEPEVLPTPNTPWEEPGVQENTPFIPGEPQTPTENKRPFISEKARTEGLVIAEKLASEVNEIVADNPELKKYIGQINSENAYTVLTAFNKAIEKGINEKVLVDISDPLNRLSYKETKHIANALLKQAAGMGLEETEAYKALKAEYERVSDIVEQSEKADPSRPTARVSDARIQAMLNEMTKALNEADSKPIEQPKTHSPEYLEKKAQLEEQKEKLERVKDDPNYPKEHLQEIKDAIARLTAELVTME